MSQKKIEEKSVREKKCKRKKVRLFGDSNFFPLRGKVEQCKTQLRCLLGDHKAVFKFLRACNSPPIILK